jgi:hypothetical protein
MDEIGGRGGWIAAMVLAFFVWWPLGLAILGFLAFSGRLKPWKHCGPGRWYAPAEPGSAQHSSFGPFGCWNRGGASPSGNRAFDEYRAETLRRLEEEQKEFQEYLERLRQAKDKAEFDQFMADRRTRHTPPAEPPVPQA